MEDTRIEGLDIPFSRRGTGDPVVLMHGGEADQRDMGASETAAGSYEVEDLAREAALLVRSLGYDRAHFLGTSFGGLIGQALALTQRDIVDRLVLAVTFPNSAAMGRFTGAETAQILQAGRTGDEAAKRKASEMFFSPVALV